MYLSGLQLFAGESEVLSKGDFILIAEENLKNIPSEEPNERPGRIDMIGVIIGSLAALLTILIAVVIFVIYRHKRKQNSLKRNNLKSAISDNHTTLSLRSSSNGKILNGHLYNGVAVDDVDSDRDCSHGKFSVVLLKY